MGNISLASELLAVGHAKDLEQNQDHPTWNPYMHCKWSVPKRPLRIAGYLGET